MNAENAAVDPTPATAEVGVTNAEVKPFAKRRCKWCSGSGTVSRAPSGRPARKSDVFTATLCGCALQGFLRANAAAVVVRGESLVWRVSPHAGSPDAVPA